MKAELYKRLFRAIFSEDISSLKKIAFTVIHEERKLGHNILADSLEKISITESDNKTKKYTIDELLELGEKRIVLSWQRLLRKIKTINLNNLSFMV